MYISLFYCLPFVLIKFTFKYTSLILEMEAKQLRQISNHSPN